MGGLYPTSSATGEVRDTFIFFWCCIMFFVYLLKDQTDRHRRDDSGAESIVFATFSVVSIFALHLKCPGGVVHAPHNVTRLGCTLFIFTPLLINLTAFGFTFAFIPVLPVWFYFAQREMDRDHHFSA